MPVRFFLAGIFKNVCEQVWHEDQVSTHRLFDWLEKNPTKELKEVFYGIFQQSIWKTPCAVKTNDQNAFEQHFQDDLGQNQAHVNKYMIRGF